LNAIDRRLKRASITYFENFNWNQPLAVTLTLKKVAGTGPNMVRGTQENYQRNLNHFLNVLNRRIFQGGSRKGKTVQVVPVLERDQSGRAHYHLMLDVPKGVIWFWLKDQIEQIWPKTDWGFQQIDVRLETQGHWLKYMMKFRSKNDYDLAIDWENVRRP
jgi:hypothetical protein